MKLPGNLHLTYCSNIHPGESWEEVRKNLGIYLPNIRKQLCPEQPFGVGLRLSDQAARTLGEPAALLEFEQFLAREDCYVFTLNGFPYGVFHHARVKEEVYLPDWRDTERLEYTNRMAAILARLLPEEEGLEGSVSTVPGAFKGALENTAESGEYRRVMARNMLAHAAELHRIREQTGKTITLALEPEPCCMIETVEEAVDFFQDYLHSPTLQIELANILKVSQQEAEAITKRHIGLCYDACHMAVEFEDIATSLRTLQEAEIKICKFQISSALALQFERGDGQPEKLLRPFVESTYLHQVVERSPGGMTRYVDLPEALADAENTQSDGEELGEPVEWRVHFHVPVFLDQMENFGTTQSQLGELLELIRSGSHCPYLEVETYTWDVLPEQYRTDELSAAIIRELEWVKKRITP